MMENDDAQKIYLDWNVFNKLEHITDIPEESSNPFRLLHTLILSGAYIAPYSNAHINDLYRGYIKAPSYASGHTANISLLTDNLCMTQYWGESSVRFHKRDPMSYLLDIAEENSHTSSSFSALFESIGDPLAESIFELQKTLLRLQPVPPAFKQLYSQNPIFNSIYPRTKLEMNHLALCEDIYEFSFKIKNDFTLYKHFRKYLMETKSKYPQYRQLFNAAETKVIGHPKYLAWDDIWEEMEPKFKGTSNPAYDKIMNLFTTTDLKGYRQDERFANLLDDALHCFYAAHCDYFITLDKRCYDKAKVVYEKLKIRTVVLTPEEFYGFG